MTRYVPSHFDNPNTSNWRTAVRGMKLFIYYKNEMEPRFIFVKNGPSAEWRGYDQHFTSIVKALAWCREKGKP